MPPAAAGNEMIVLSLRVFNEQGRSTIIKDWLLEKIAYKLRHACEACGLLEAYMSPGLLTGVEDFVGKTGKVKLKIQPAAAEPYPAKNSVSDYVTEDLALAGSGGRARSALEGGNPQ